jgi:hypothetical protein
MGIYQAVVGAKITAAEWNTYYNLLKGVVGGEDTVRLANNVADTLLLQPNTDPGSVVHLFPIKTQAGVEKWALRSDGIPVFVDQAGTPGSLENGMLWQNGGKFYGRLGGATLEMTTGNPGLFLTTISTRATRVRIPIVSALVLTGTPSHEVFNTYVVRAFDGAATEALIFHWSVPADWSSGNISVFIRWANMVNDSGNVRWLLGYKQVANNGAALNGAWTESAANYTPPGGLHYFLTTNIGTIPPVANNELVIKIERQGGDAGDTSTHDVGLIGIELAYTANIQP